MYLRRKLILRRLKFHFLLKALLTSISYILLVLSIGTFAFYIFNNPQKRYKIVNEYKKGKKDAKTEKVMTNPMINFKYDDNQIFKIRARSASHTDQSSVTMYDVNAKGDLGSITAGKAQMNQNGERLIFTQNPVLIIDNKEK